MLEGSFPLPFPILLLSPSRFSLVTCLSLLLNPSRPPTILFICIQTWMSFSYTVIVYQFHFPRFSSSSHFVVF